ncbi:MAG: hypothetical protein ACAI44_35210 [Candidatus Sericytochromatia bacterium]
MKWHTQLSAVTLAGLLAWTPLAAQAETLQTVQSTATQTTAAEAAPTNGAWLDAALIDTALRETGQSDSFALSRADKIEIAQLDRREGETLEDLKRDPARAALLSILYPGLGQLYIGNDLQRSLIVMGAGTVIIAGSIVGFGLLAGRPPEASSLGNLMIVAVLVGYHLWNIRDAYVQASEYNLMLEQQHRISWFDGLGLGWQNDTLTLSWSSSL